MLSSNDTVYVFGGSDQLATTNSFDSIYAINPETGAVRTVAATLPAGRNNATAVYLDHLNKIVILGGWYYDAGVEKYAEFESTSLMSPAKRSVNCIVHAAATRLWFGGGLFAVDAEGLLLRRFARWRRDLRRQRLCAHVERR